MVDEGELNEESPKLHGHGGKAEVIGPGASTGGVDRQSGRPRWRPNTVNGAGNGLGWPERFPESGTVGNFCVWTGQNCWSGWVSTVPEVGNRWELAGEGAGRESRQAPTGSRFRVYREPEPGTVGKLPITCGFTNFNFGCGSRGRELLRNRWGTRRNGQGVAVTPQRFRKSTAGCRMRRRSALTCGLASR